MSKQKDRIYRGISAKPGSFVFDSKVASVFEDMISRSVPGYQQILEMLPTLTRQFYFKQSNYYDLGCSLGAGLLAMATGLKGHQANLIGVDNSEAMIDQARQNLADLESNISVNLLEQDLLQSNIHSAALVLMNFTLQFIAIESRALVIKTIFDGLRPGGALVLSEKIQFDDHATNTALINIHHQYKADQGYSSLEIAQKRDAIENVLIPETLDAHTERLKAAGFSIVTPWVQNLQFISILAIK